MAYPVKPSGNDILPFDTIFADNNNLKTAMTINEILDGYNNDGETETQLTSRPDANRFNMFWYQVHNTIKWVVEYIEELYNAKVEKSGATMTGILNMGANKVTSTHNPTNPEDLTNKQYVDRAINGSMWIGEVKMLSYPKIPNLPANVEVIPCDGRAISRTQYAEYFSMVGTAFGAGNGSTTFNVPDYRGVFIRGWDGGSGRDANRVYGKIQNSGCPNITGSGQWTQEWETFGVVPYTGAFYLMNRGGNGVDGRHGNFDIVGFDASRVSRVYQNGLTECRPINSNGYYVVRIK